MVHLNDRGKMHTRGIIDSPNRQAYSEVLYHDCRRKMRYLTIHGFTETAQVRSLHATLCNNSETKVKAWNSIPVSLFATHRSKTTNHPTFSHAVFSASLL
jgi:hypothetical protein